MISLKQNEKVCIVLGGGPTLEAGLIYLDSLGCPDDAGRFVIGTSPILVSNLHTDLQLVELPDEEKIEKEEPSIRVYCRYLEEVALDSTANNMFVIKTGTLQIIKNDMRELRNIKRTKTIYSSRFIFVTVWHCLRLLLTRLRSRRDFVLHSRSSITTAIDLAVLLGFRRVIVIGFCPEEPGYYFYSSPALVKKGSPLPRARDTVNIDRNAPYLRRFICVYRLSVRILFGVKIHIL